MLKHYKLGRDVLYPLLCRLDSYYQEFITKSLIADNIFCNTLTSMKYGSYAGSLSTEPKDNEYITKYYFDNNIKDATGSVLNKIHKFYCINDVIEITPDIACEANNGKFYIAEKDSEEPIDLTRIIEDPITGEITKIPTSIQVKKDNIYYVNKITNSDDYGIYEITPRQYEISYIYNKHQNEEYPEKDIDTNYIYNLKIYKPENITSQLTWCKMFDDSSFIKKEDYDATMKILIDKVNELIEVYDNFLSPEAREKLQMLFNLLDSRQYYLPDEINSTDIITINDVEEVRNIFITKRSTPINDEDEFKQYHIINIIQKVNGHYRLYYDDMQDYINLPDNSRIESFDNSVFFLNGGATPTLYLFDVNETNGVIPHEDHEIIIDSAIKYVFNDPNLDILTLHINEYGFYCYIKKLSQDDCCNPIYDYFIYWMKVVNKNIVNSSTKSKDNLRIKIISKIPLYESFKNDNTPFAVNKYQELVYFNQDNQLIINKQITYFSDYEDETVMQDIKLNKNNVYVSIIDDKNRVIEYDKYLNQKHFEIDCDKITTRGKYFVYSFIDNGICKINYITMIQKDITIV